MSPGELATLLHLERLGTMSTEPQAVHAPLEAAGLVERFTVEVGRFTVPRVRITKAGRAALQSAGFKLRARKQ